jgi:ACS family hexuronate transporter-like MFS transporter
MPRRILFAPFAIGRAALGFGEAGVFPASTKSGSEWFPNVARKSAMLTRALCVVSIATVYRISGLWLATLLIGLAAAGHSRASPRIFSPLSSDLFPSRAVASVAGFGGMAGAVGGMLIAQIVGHVLLWTNSYTTPFFIAASRISSPC